MRKPAFRVVQPSEQKMTRGLNCWILREEGLHYLFKDTDQLRVKCAADVRLCFCIQRKQVPHDVAHIKLQGEDYKSHFARVL